MSQKTPAPVDSLSFEEALDELKRIVESLESGQSKLDAAIAAYERGARLKAHCEAKLKEAQLKIERVQSGAKGVTSEPFEQA